MDIKMKVNVLPAITYNWLHMNDDEIDEKNIEITRTYTIKPDSVPENVSFKEKITSEDVSGIFSKAVSLEKRADEEFTPPNGDMYNNSARQTVRTGMGAEADELFDGLGADYALISVADNVQVTEPVIFREKMSDNDNAVSRQVIYAGKNSKITVIMEYLSEKDVAGFHGISTRLYAAEGSQINLIKVQMLGNGFIHMDDIGGVCEDKAAINVIQMELGAAKAWDGCNIDLLGDKSLFCDETGYLCRGRQKLDMNYIARQRGRKTKSEMIFHGVLLDQAQKTFRGTIDFRKGSSGSEGDEQEDTLLLSPDVINKTIPIILCEEEDVNGRHGATIGQLGEDMLFYMQSRGMSEETAKKIMIRARLESISGKIPDGELRKMIELYIDRELG